MLLSGVLFGFGGVVTTGASQVLCLCSYSGLPRALGGTTGRTDPQSGSVMDVDDLSLWELESISAPSATGVSSVCDGHLLGPRIGSTSVDAPAPRTESIAE